MQPPVGGDSVKIIGSGGPFGTLKMVSRLALTQWLYSGAEVHDLAERAA